MKISQVSTQSLFSTLRESMSNLQRDLVDAQLEVSTGRKADASLFLGERNGRRVSLTADVSRFNTIMDTNSLALSRLEMSLSATSTINDVTQDLLSSLTTTIGDDSTLSVTTNAGKMALSTITGILNTTLNGQYIFGGVNSGQPALADFETGGAKTALDTAFQTYFGFPKTDPAALSIDSASITTFLDTIVDPMFEGVGWATNLSSATDEVINARINVAESSAASVSANESGFQSAVYAAVLTSEFLDGSLGGEARSAIAQKAIGLVGQTSAELAGLQGKMGLMANRIDESSDRLKIQIDELTAQADEMVAVDPYEAATRLNSLITQIETSYTLTGRMQQLSLMRFI